jgi:hypothetical protein
LVAASRDLIAKAFDSSDGGGRGRLLGNGNPSDTVDGRGAKVWIQ